jgi:hypothetical protein
MERREACARMAVLGGAGGPRHTAGAALSVCTTCLSGYCPVLPSKSPHQAASMRGGRCSLGLDIGFSCVTLAVFICLRFSSSLKIGFSFRCHARLDHLRRIDNAVERVGHEPEF